MVRSVLVCGSRSWQDYRAIFLAIQRIEPNVVIEGGARGADRHARNAAHALHLHVASVPALWGIMGKRAGRERNAAMLALKPDLVLAFWDGESRGTAHMIGLAEKAGVPVEVVRP